MTKLLAAGFSRLWKTKTFWLAAAFMFGAAAFAVITQYKYSLEDGYEIAMNSFVFGFTLIIGILAAVFSNFFIGTEYSDGTIRNKLIVGHKRPAVYCSNLIITITAALLISAAYLIALFAIGTPLIGFIDFTTTSVMDFIALSLGSIIMVCSVCAVLTAVNMLISNKAIAAIVCILSMVVLLVISVEVSARLDEPELHSGVYMLIDGELVPQEELRPNPRYLKGMSRVVYEYLRDVLPTGQALQYANIGMGVEHPWWLLPLYSLAIAALSTLIGVLFFQRKDIK